MPGLFQGLEVGKRALLSHQLWLQTLGHNIANVNTPGYSRQRVTVTASRPEDLSYGSIGTGIQTEDIRHARDIFLSQQYQQSSKSLGQWTYKQKTMSQIESIVNEPQDSSLNDLLNQFWDAWSELSTGDATSSSNRANVLARANELVNGIHVLATRLNSLRDSIDKDLGNFTNQINQITSDIANLNKQIRAAELGASPANDLRDARDYLVDQLADLIDVNAHETSDGTMLVSMGAMVLVDGADQLKLGVQSINDAGVSTHRLVWEGTSVQLKNLNGQMAGLLESRDKILPEYIAQLDRLTRTLVEEVNAIHSTGYAIDGSTGVDFFDPNFTDAATVRINNLIQTDPEKIVASDAAAENNLKIALSLSDLRYKTVLEGNSMTMNDYYTSLVGKLGIQSHEAESFSGNFELMVQQVDNMRQSVQGVSLDEEMANLIKYQHAYDAAARVITTMDQALDTLINGMGIVGR